MDAEFAALAAFCERQGWSACPMQALPSGGNIVRIENVRLVHGWNRQTATLLFLAPPGYPAAKPDCFWVEPANFRLESGATPQAANDGNPIPGDTVPGRSTTWFSWHLSNWTPGKDGLVTYLQMILTRLSPAR